MKCAYLRLSEFTLSLLLIQESELMPHRAFCFFSAILSLGFTLFCGSYPGLLWIKVFFNYRTTRSGTIDTHATFFLKGCSERAKLVICDSVGWKEIFCFCKCANCSLKTFLSCFLIRIKVEITASLFRSKIFVNFSESECSLKLIITKSETEYHIRKNPVESSHSWSFVSWQCPPPPPPTIFHSNWETRSCEVHILCLPVGFKGVNR